MSGAAEIVWLIVVVTTSAVGSNVQAVPVKGATTQQECETVLAIAPMPPSPHGFHQFSFCASGRIINGKLVKP